MVEREARGEKKGAIKAGLEVGAATNGCEPGKGRNNQDASHAANDKWHRITLSVAENLEVLHGERGESQMHRVHDITRMHTTKRHLSIGVKFPR